MSIDNLSTPRSLMSDLQGVPSQVELPRGKVHMAQCNLPVRTGFSEPLPLAQEHPYGESDAVAQAHYQQLQYQRCQAEKAQKMAQFQKRVKERLRAAKAQERKTKLDRTLQLTESENLLMKSLDPVRKPPVLATSLIAINSQVSGPKKAEQQLEAATLARCNKLARNRLVGDKSAPPPPLSPVQVESEESESEGDKENVGEVQRKERKLLSEAEQKTLRKHRIQESRRAYSMLERQRIQEKARELEHRATAMKLQEDTERDREIAEQLVNQAIIKCKAESPLKGESVEKRIQKTVHKNKKISTQSDRLIKRLRSKIATMSSRPPSLCPCDRDILNTGPGYCATNCNFNANSKAFAQALSSLVGCYS